MTTTVLPVQYRCRFCGLRWLTKNDAAECEQHDIDADAQGRHVWRAEW